MKGALSAAIAALLSVCAWAMAFFAPGRPDSSGWYWSCGASAEWQFFDLGAAGEYLLFGITLETRGWTAAPPPLFSVTLSFSSFGCGKVIKTVHLQKVAERGTFVRYFGQVFLARRDLGFGSYLRVCLKAADCSAEVGLHCSSLQLLSQPVITRGYGAGGPFVPEAQPNTFDNPSPGGGGYFEIRECADADSAPYLAPGVYRGELGWPGPGHPLDDRDWFRINARPGQFIEVVVKTPWPLRLGLFSPAGREVAHVEGQGRLGLIFEAGESGPYGVCLAIYESTPPFSYAVEVRLSR